MDKEKELFAIQKYFGLIKSYLSGTVSVSEFEIEYLRIFKEEEFFFSPRVFDALDSLFSELDALPSERKSRVESEQMLKLACEQTLAQIIEN